MLDVLDFGGSLGSSYFQCKRFLQPLARVRWNIVEQASFVAVGRAELETEELRFFADIDACLAAHQPRVLVLASVLQFLPEPDAIVRRLLTHPFDVVVIDRTPMWHAASRITIQHVPEEIYGRAIKYPARIFNRDELVAPFAAYELLSEFETDDGPIWCGGHTGWHGGFLFVRRI
jgi:putative methyltransferase (TIGR04325 family)